MSDAFINGLITAKTEAIMTPKMFQYQIFNKARRLQKCIVLPEGNDKRVVSAAGELAARGLCKVILMGNEEEVKALASTNHNDLSLVKIIDPATSADTNR
eukprot:1188449-Prorocentrum_minimum.AAC.3